MTTKEKLTLLLNEANDDFSNVEVYLPDDNEVLKTWEISLHDLTDSYYELLIKEQL